MHAILSKKFSLIAVIIAIIQQAIGKIIRHISVDGAAVLTAFLYDRIFLVNLNSCVDTM